MKPLDPVLQRQLRKVGVDGVTPPDADQWTLFTERISESYTKAREDRELLTRSLELSTAEMAKLNDRLMGERDRMAAMVAAIGEAMAVLEEAAASPSAGQTDIHGALSVARRRFGARVGELFGAAPATSWEDTASTFANADPRSADTVTVDTLRRGFTGLADQMGRMLLQTAEVAAIRKELEVAGAVQQMLLPTEDLHVRGPLRVAGSFQPASDCGGDWWTVRNLEDGRILVVIGDVTGHGIPSAIVTGVAKGACDVALDAVPDLQTGDLLELMNRAISGSGRQRMLMTCQVGIFDPDGRRLVIGNAGHPFAFLVRNGQTSRLIAGGSPLGSTVPGDFPPIAVDTAPGDLVVWFTDGVTELEDPNGEPFGERRLRNLLAEVGTSDVRDVRAEIRRSLERFRGERPAADDVTFVVVQVTR